MDEHDREAYLEHLNGELREAEAELEIAQDEAEYFLQQIQRRNETIRGLQAEIEKLEK